MALVAAARLNKQIAAEIEITEATVKLHRGQVMRKMRARSLADVVRMADKLELTYHCRRPPRPRSSDLATFRDAVQTQVQLSAGVAWRYGVDILQCKASHDLFSRDEVFVS